MPLYSIACTCNRHLLHQSDCCTCTSTVLVREDSRREARGLQDLINSHDIVCSQARLTVLCLRRRTGQLRGCKVVQAGPGLPPGRLPYLATARCLAQCCPTSRVGLQCCSATIFILEAAVAVTRVLKSAFEDLSCALLAASWHPCIADGADLGACAGIYEHGAIHGNLWHTL